MTHDAWRTCGRLSLFACIAVLLFSACRLYRFSYFSRDDFNNLALAQYASARVLAWDNIHPSANTYRPFGTTIYWACLHLFGLNAPAYHLLAWTLHALNVIVIFRILKYASGSTYSAAVGSMLFVFHAATADILFDFGTIFDLVAGFFFFLTVWIYLCARESKAGMASICLIYFLANNTKEMAITLPFVLLLYELLVGRLLVIRNDAKKDSRPRWLPVAFFSLLAAIGLWFLLAKSSLIGTTPASDPYHMDFTGVTLGRGYGWYWNALYHTRLRWGGWMAFSFLLFCLLLLKRSRWGLFFLLYIFITLLPVVFLVNHRSAFYWYIPFLGLSGLVALAVKRLSAWARGEMTPRMAVIAGVVVFALGCRLHYQQQKRLNQTRKEDVMALSAEYRSFLSGLRGIGEPGPDETIYYQSVPRDFEPVVTLAATQLAFRRTDLKAQIVDKFPPEARYRIRFEHGRVIAQK
ncbi:MAG TPA: hypothetical protein VGQ81_04910 [Acidobacteriota bacterium]|jgi:hypothetical protein|nr:hypothetical protein [Acidobacteriota bacterium]